MASGIADLELALAAAPPFEEMVTPELAAVLVRADAFARARGHEDVVLEHVTLAILVDPVASEVLRLSGADVDRARIRTAQALERRTTPLNWKIIFDVIVKLARLHALTNRAKITTGHLVISTLRMDGVAAGEYIARSILVEHGLTLLGLREVIAYGSTHVRATAPLPPAVARKGVHVHELAPGQYEAVLHNDEFTTLETVQKILHSVFRKSNDEAAACAQLTHERGEAVVGVYDLAVAIKKVEKATRLARAAEFPLRLSIRPRGG